MSKILRSVYASILVLSLVLTSFGRVSAEELNVETPFDHLKALFATPELFRLAKTGGDEWVDISLILTVDADVSQWVDHLILRNPIGDIRAATGRVKANNLGKLAATPGVLSIRPLEVRAKTLRPIPLDGERPLVERGPKGLLRNPGTPIKIAKIGGKGSRVTKQPGLTSYEGVDIMGARAAWQLGYTGRGVIVGQLDDGCDFGHPDLENTWAVVTDETSPYYGWPMVYDPGPALAYVGYGEAFSWKTVWEETLGGLYSYYVDTSYTPKVTISVSGITATAVITTVGYADPPTYTEPAILSHVYTFPNMSKSGVYHAGIHPESLLSLFNIPGEYVAVLLVDEKAAGVYDTVYVDWDSNYVFDSYERFTKAHPTGWYYDEASESWSRDVTGDGVADVSAGILYWIANGQNLIPGTDVIYLPEYLSPPDNGSLVLFYGNFNGNSHGTGTGSAVVAQSVITGTQAADGTLIPAWADVSQGTVWGAAPEAKIFSSNLFSIGTTDLDSWLVHALGYDGLPGTGDEAQIDTNSWGWLTWEDAWLHNESRLITRLNSLFPDTVWFFGTANGGFGYGTSNAPGTSSTAIAVAGYDLNGTVLSSAVGAANEPIAGEDQLLYGDLTPYSSRGPNTAGRGSVGIMGIADGATGDLPLLHVAINQQGQLDGQMAWEEFGGTSQATPFVAGIGALVCQAYKGANGQWPDYVTLKEILMSSATDANNDPFVQGAGRADAKKAVEVAAGLGSFYVSPSHWNAGDYRGATYGDFAYLVAPGSSTSQTFTVHNTGPSTLTLTISDETLMQIGTWETTLTTTVAAEEPTSNLTKPDYLVPLYLKDGVNRIPEGTELMVVRLAVPYDKFSLGDPTIPASQTIDSLWYMKALNWKDLNGNGLLWNDANGNGAVNNGELDNPPVDPGIEMYENSSQEINEFNIGRTLGTTQECRVERPLERADDGLYIGLIHHTSARRKIGKPIPETVLSIRATFYKHVDMPWVKTDVATLTVGAGITGTFVSTVTVPSAQGPGLYQSAIRVSGGGQKATIPVVINVPAVVTANNLNFGFGGKDPSGYLYDNSYIYGGFEWLGNGWYDQGDWRMYFVDVPDEASLSEGTCWLVDTQWQSARTDIDTLVFGPMSDSYSARYPEVFGPYTLGIVGGSANTLYDREDVFDWGGYAYAWKTNTGMAQETVTAPIQHGLHAIELQNVLYGGIAPSERFTGTVGAVSVAPYPIKITTTKLSGSATVTFTSSLQLSGLGYGGSFGLSKPMLYKDQPIEQDEQKTHRFDVNKSALLELTLSTKDPESTPDLDLYLYRSIAGKWVRIAYSAGATSDEYIKIIRPPDGSYLAMVRGYTVIGRGTYDLVIRSIEGSDLTVTGLPTGTITADMPYHLTLNYSRKAATGWYEGLILLGTDKAPAILEVPVEITFIPHTTLYMPLIMKP